MKAKKLKIQWKQNFRKVPDKIVEKLKTLGAADFVVACAKKIKASDILAGVYSHVGLHMEGDKLIFPTSVMPDPQVGKFSTVNVHGKEIVRKDLPMLQMTRSFESPNYGDWSKGSHEVSWTQDVYQRDFISPKELEIQIELIGEEVSNEEKIYVVRFCVNEVLKKGSNGFKEALLFNLNVLQENVGAADIYLSKATRDDYLKTVYVNWEILPPGERDTTIARILSGIKAPTDQLKQKLIERYDLLAKLKPASFIRGTSGFNRYFGAKFKDDLVVFENLEYGNAIYIMFDQWEGLSKLSRIELLKGNRNGFVRILHIPGWKTALRQQIAERK